MNAFQATQIFSGDNGSPIPLLRERVKCLNEAGHGLLKSFDGQFINALRSSNNSAITLIFDHILPNFPSFRDVAIHRGKQVSFYKRAQILCADIWACFGGKGIGEFVDIGRLTMFADYRVPQMLVGIGALRYSEALQDTLKSKQILESGSQLECEIRGCSIHVVELIKNAIHCSGHKHVSAVLIDFYLWDTAKQLSVSLDPVPIHRTVSVFY